SIGRSRPQVPGSGGGEVMAGTASAPHVLAASRISKSFGDVPVLFSVDFDVRAGEVHALIGQPSAGKPTLIKMHSRIAQPTSGTIYLDGEPIRLPPNGEAEGLGIVVIHQELNLAEHLTVAESIFLGREWTRFGFLRRTDMQAEAQRILDSLHVAI